MGQLRCAPAPAAKAGCHDPGHGAGLVCQDSTYPRARHDTGAPPTPAEIAQLLAEHWRWQPLEIKQAQSRRVHFVRLADREVVFRANAGWDGPTAPALLVRFVHHLAACGAAAPQIIPTDDGRLSVPFGDYTASVESKLPGVHPGPEEFGVLRSVGESLARIHVASEAFPELPGTMRPVREYVMRMMEASLRRDMLGDRERRAIELLRQELTCAYASQLDMRVPWLLCRGDVRGLNTLCADDGSVWFTDFDSAYYAPVLVDVAMTRYQWRLGVHGSPDMPEAGEVLRGYHAVRPLSPQERVVFPLIWAAYYADRITFLFDRHGRKGRISEPRRQEILDLPDNAIPKGAELVGRAELICSTGDGDETTE